MNRKLNVGDRVRVRSELEFFPHFIVKPGATGVVSWAQEGCPVWVKMDDHIDGCEYWDNEVGFGWGSMYEVSELEVEEWR